MSGRTCVISLLRRQIVLLIFVREFIFAYISVYLEWFFIEDASNVMFEAIVMKYDKEEVSEWIYVHVKINRVVR